MHAGLDKGKEQPGAVYSLLKAAALSGCPSASWFECQAWELHAQEFSFSDAAQMDRY